MAGSKRKRAHIHTHRPMQVQASRVRADINVTPLVDVVLVLLIIFLVITPLLQRGVPIDLPGTAHHTKQQDNGEQLVVSVRADGVYIGSDRIADAKSQPGDDNRTKLEARLRSETKSSSRPVHIRADRSLTYGTVRHVLEAAHAAGANQIGMATQDLQPGKP